VGVRGGVARASENWGRLLRQVASDARAGFFWFCTVALGLTYQVDESWEGGEAELLTNWTFALLC
jgi:hypothetical protein